MPTDDLPETFHVTTGDQLRAVSNLTRHRIMAVLRFEPATITQIAERVGLAKGSSSYHVRLLERAGLVKVVRTRKVRGVTERYYAMAARAIVLPDPGEGGPDVLMRHAVADLEAAPADGERHVRMAHLRLTEEQFAHLGARLQALADEFRELSDPSLPDASLVFALFHPAAREQAGQPEESAGAEQVAGAGPDKGAGQDKGPDGAEQTEQTERAEGSAGSDGGAK